jgi:hypothetical protein
VINVLNKLNTSNGRCHEDMAVMKDSGSWYGYICIDIGFGTAHHSMVEI